MPKLVVAAVGAMIAAAAAVKAEVADAEQTVLERDHAVHCSSIALKLEEQLGC